MTLPTWPSQVDSGARDGWQMPDMFRAPIATDMDGGNQRLRSQPGSNVASITYPLKPMNVTAYGYFDTFMRTTLNNGASRWTMTITTPDGTASKTVQLDGGRSASVTKSGGWIHVTLPLRVYW